MPTETVNLVSLCKFLWPAFWIQPQIQKSKKTRHLLYVSAEKVRKLNVFRYFLGRRVALLIVTRGPRTRLQSKRRAPPIPPPSTAEAIRDRTCLGSAPHDELPRATESRRHSRVVGLPNRVAPGRATVANTNEILPYIYIYIHI